MDLLQICSGMFLLGTTGSGKTSVLRILMQAILNHHVSCLWCCVKQDEADNAQAVIESTVMRDRLLRLRPGEFTFNFAAYELSRTGGSPATLTRLFERLNKQLRNASSGGSNEEFWASLFFDYMHFAIWVAWLAHRDQVTVEHIHDVITSSPATTEEAKSEAFKHSPCWQMLQLADKNIANDGEDRALYKAGEFFLFKQTRLGENARGAGVQQCSSVLLPFLMSPLNETVCASQSSFTPDMPLNDYCCVLDFPILVYGQGGMLFQSLVTMLVQEAALRRQNPESICAIVRDEFQYLCADPEFETMVQSVARSQRLASIAAAQNIPLLYAAVGGDHRAETLIRSLLPNYTTKLLLANNCDTTNRLFSDMFGQFKDQFISLSESPKEDPKDFLSAVFGANPFQFSTSQQLHSRLPPESFLTLRRGGPPFDFLIDAYLTIGGHTFANGLPFKQVTFSQK